MITQGMGRNQRLITQGMGRRGIIQAVVREVVRLTSFITRTVRLESWLK